MGICQIQKNLSFIFPLLSSRQLISSQWLTFPLQIIFHNKNSMILEKETKLQVFMILIWIELILIIPDVGMNELFLGTSRDPEIYFGSEKFRFPKGQVTLVYQSSCWNIRRKASVKVKVLSARTTCCKGRWHEVSFLTWSPPEKTEKVSIFPKMTLND